MLIIIIIQDVSPAESVCVNDMVEAIAVSRSPVKSQQIGEPELTLTERREELLRQYRSKPLVFLERYHVCAHNFRSGALLLAVSNMQTYKQGAVNS